MISVVLIASAATLLAPVAGALGHRRLKPAAGARLMRIDAPDGIDEQGFVRIGGIEQWIPVRGEDRDNPVVLEIHGGPGASNAIHGPRTRPREEHLTIVRWDMRGTGKTLRRSGPDHQGERSFARVVLKSLWFSPLHSLGELGALGRGMKLSEQILPATAGFDDWADGTDFDLPFFILQGERGVLTPADRAERFLDDVRAPHKEFALIEGASHFASFRHPEQFLHLMLTKVRPLVTNHERAGAR
ncbi:hypothetical protein AB0D08_28095 [Kitasatospora sp. NPDC048540]|uniref:alpha/beta fold hydrolase n=1 Tax=Kitasatospora sp. NPDC048540 TaxID=3155634 RepID=UPI0033C48C77